MGNLTKKIISKKNLLNNIKWVKELTAKQTLICAMVKANAYGHGLEQVVQAVKEDVDFFGVANLDEALGVRLLAPLSKVLIVGKTDDFIMAIENDISFSIFSLQEMQNLIQKMNNYAGLKIPKIHIKINCGMNRFGVSSISEFQKVYKLALANNIIVEGVFTHFSTAGVDEEIFVKQKLKFKNFIKEIPNNQLPIIHIGGSGVLLKNNKKTIYKLPEIDLDFNMVRVGILLYGYSPSKKIDGLKKVMKIESKIVQIISVKKGEYVGYGKNFRAKKDMQVAIVPIGYADGLLRAYSKGSLKIIKKIGESRKIYNSKIIGNICMDLTMIDVSEVENVEVGDRVIVLDNAEKMANELSTISYEILTNFSKLRV